MAKSQWDQDDNTLEHDPYDVQNWPLDDLLDVYLAEVAQVPCR